MDRSIEQLGQDLARANYAKTTRERYIRAAGELAEHCRRPLVDVTREELRGCDWVAHSLPPHPGPAGAGVVHQASAPLLATAERTEPRGGPRVAAGLAPST